MAAIKAILLAGLVTGALFLIVIWIIPVATFLIIFGIIALIAYAIIHENEPKGPPYRD
jgi:hypothetical protein